MSKIRTSVSYEPESASITYHFGTGSGEDWQQVQQASFSLEDLPGYAELDGVAQTVALYGLNKALSDRTSDKAMEAEWKNGDPEPRIAAMNEVFDLFLANMWKQQRQGGGASGGVPAIVVAIARVKDISVDAAQRSWKQTDDATKERIKQNEDVKAKLEEVKEERKQHQATSLEDLAEG